MAITKEAEKEICREGGGGKGGARGGQGEQIPGAQKRKKKNGEMKTCRLAYRIYSVLDSY